MKNLSIIVDFGCPFDCWFCIADSQKTKKGVDLSERKINELLETIEEGLERGFTRISISGGGEPLYFHSEGVVAFHKILQKHRYEHKYHLSVHTNHLKPPFEILENEFDFDKYVVSVNEKNYKNKFENWEFLSELNHQIRFTHVSDGKDINLIEDMIQHLPGDAQFTVKQMDGIDECYFRGIEDLLNELKDERVRFLPSGDYNMYYNFTTDKLYDNYKEMLVDINN